MGSSAQADGSAVEFDAVLDVLLTARLLELGWTPPPDQDHPADLDRRVAALDGVEAQRSYAEDLAVARVRARHAADNHDLLDRAAAARERSQEIAAQARRQQARISRVGEPRDHRDELESEVEQLHQALRSRASIDQAVGIVMACLQCDAADAFQALAKLSQTTNTKVRDLARDLVEQVGAGTVAPGVLRDRFHRVTGGRQRS